jgi:hypothetical protein
LRGCTITNGKGQKGFGAEACVRERAIFELKVVKAIKALLLCPNETV